MLRKVVPHRDRANTAAFLEEVISYVLGLKKRLAELEGVREADLHVPLVDVQTVLASGDVPEGASAQVATGTVVGAPATSSAPLAAAAAAAPVANASSSHSGAGAAAPAAAQNVAAGIAAPQQLSGMSPMMLPQCFRDGAMVVEPDHKGPESMLTARGMPAPQAMNGANQVRRVSYMTIAGAMRSRFDMYFAWHVSVRFVINRHSTRHSREDRPLMAQLCLLHKE